MAVMRHEDEWYVAECPEVGTASQGRTVEEALANLQEATEAFLEEFPATEEHPVVLATFEIRMDA